MPPRDASDGVRIAGCPGVEATTAGLNPAFRPRSPEESDHGHAPTRFAHCQAN